MATTANITFANAKVYDVKKLDVKLGDKFAIELIDAPTPVDWYSKADQVLDIEQDEATALVEATAVGSTKIRIYNSAEQKILEISIEVMEAIQGPAVDLGLKAGEPEPKKNKNR